LCEFDVEFLKQMIPFKFTIQLEEEKIDEKSLLTKQIERQNKLIDRLTNEMELLTQKVSNQEKIIAILGGAAGVGDVSGIEFDSSNLSEPSASLFRFSNYGRTLTFLGDQGSRGILAKNPLPKNTKSTFAIRIDYTEANHQSRRLMIGICTSAMKNSTSSSFTHGIGSFTYNSNGNGWIYEHGLAQYDGGKSQYLNAHGGGQHIVMKQFKKYGGVTGTIIKVTTDLSTADVTFYYNDDPISTLPLDKALTQYYDYYPFVEMATKYDRVSFVSFTTDI
jgi:hypothetical protein